MQVYIVGLGYDVVDDAVIEARVEEGLGFRVWVLRRRRRSYRGGQSRGQ
jgi:putative component of toxin-antitoxin plasmid stabilization module